VFTGGEPLWPQDRLTAADFSRIFEQNWRAFFRWSNVDKLYAYLLHQIENASQALARPVAWLEKHALAALLFMTTAIFLCGSLMAHVSSAPSRPALTRMSELLIAAICLAAVALVGVAGETSEDRFLPLKLTLPSICVIAACLVHGEWPRFGLLELAALLTIVPVWQAARTSTSRLTYLAVVLLSGIFLELSEWLDGPGTIVWSRASLLAGVCLKFAAIPLVFWLLRLADELPAVVLGLIVAVVDMAAIGELALRAQIDPGLFAPGAVWVAIAVLTSLSAALLMLAQRNMNRLLVLSSIEDCGFLLLGISSISSLGQDGVVLAAASHALGKSLLFISIASPERDGAFARGDSGLATQYPYSAFGFLMGMLAMLGVPPMLGFAGRWKLYHAALQIHPLLLSGFVLASAFALVAYVSVYARVWWGSPSHGEERLSIVDGTEWYSPPASREALLLKAMILLLFLSLLFAGAWPYFFTQAFQGGRP
jgi:multicomponent Na+:H+ antiporter subunit D